MRSDGFARGNRARGELGLAVIIIGATIELGIGVGHRCHRVIVDVVVEPILFVDVEFTFVFAVPLNGEEMHRIEWLVVTRGTTRR